MPSLQDYKIIKTLATRSGARIYQAQEKSPPHRDVVLKVIPFDKDQEKAFSLLYEEFEILSHLSHPSIVHVYDVGRDRQEGVAFIAEEFLEGETAPHSRLPEKTLLQWLGRTARALHYLHRHHVYHGDIKPENIIISGDRLVLVDFGLAQKYGGEKPTEGAVQGTLNYMAPELFGDMKPRAASDLYSLGVTLYEWATGHLPFDPAASTRLIPEILWTPPPSPLKWNPDLSPALAEIILMLLQKNPLDRLQRANDLIREVNLRMQQDLPLEEERGLQNGWSLVGTLGRESLLKKIVEFPHRKKSGVFLVSGRAGLGKSAFLSALRCEEPLKEWKTFSLSVKELGSPVCLEDFLPKKIPEIVFIDDFDLLPRSLQLDLGRKACSVSRGLWVLTASSETSLLDLNSALKSSPPFGEGIQGEGEETLGCGSNEVSPSPKPSPQGGEGDKEPQSTAESWLDSCGSVQHLPLSPLDLGQVRQLIVKCLDIDGVEDSFVKTLHRLTEGRARLVLQALSILVEEAIDPLESLQPQLAKISVEDYLEGDALTGLRSRHVVLLGESRHQFIQKTRARLSQDPKNQDCRRLLARLLYENGDYQETLKIIDYDLEPLLYINTCNRLGRFEETLIHCQRARKSTETTPEIISLYNQEGIALYFLGRKEEAMTSFKKAEKKAREEKSWERVSVCLNNLANVMSHGSDPLQAISCYQESLDLAKKMGDPLSEGRALANLGHLYHMRADYRHALEYYFAGANVYRRLGFFGEMAQVKMNLGGLFMELGAWSQAEEALLTSLKLAKERGLSYQISYSYSTYAELLRRCHKFQEAEVYYNKAREGFADLNVVEEKILVFLGLIRLYLSQKKWSKAASLLESLPSESLSQRLSAQYKFLQAELLFVQGGDFLKMESLTKEALEIFASLKQVEQELLAHLLLKELYDHFHHPDKARESYRTMTHLLDQASRRIPSEYLNDFNRLIPQDLRRSES